MSHFINPTNVKTVTKVVSVDTLFRANYDTTISTDHIFTLPEPINNVTSMRLATMELPNMWYSFSGHNNSNVFYITTDLSGTVTKHTIVIPEGNYLTTYFEPMLNDLFQSMRNGLQYLKCDIDIINSKTIIRAAHEEVDNLLNPHASLDGSFNFLLDFRVDGVPKQRTAGWMMGFREEMYHVGPTDTYVDRSKYIENVTGGVDEFSGYNPLFRAFSRSETSFGSGIFHYVFLDVDDFQKNITTNTIIHSNGDSNLGKNILAKIVVSSGQFTNIIDNGGDLMFKRRNYFGPIRLEKFRIRLLDRFGEVIDLNENDFAFSLEIEQMYSR